tara:strand:- start:410 stop:1315 length:906 start_codon:yes stop_codon:yes gene_type:complete
MIKLPFGVDINNLIDDLRIISWEAAKILLYYSKMLEDSNNKSNIIKSGINDNPVTLADLKVNELIIRKINEKYKDIRWTILSEENVKLEANNSEIKDHWVWVLDPLDGTKDFIQGTGNYAMHLALTYKKKSFLGVVLIPEKNELWISDGEKLWCEKEDGTLKNFNMSKNNNLNEMILVTSKNHNNQVLKKVIEKINFKKVVVMGSIGCKIASILRGESDIYISLSLPGKSAPKDWDFAAPETILKAGGGAITNLDIKELVYLKSNFEQRGIIIASNNKQTHRKVCSQIKEIIAINDLYSFS